MPLAEKYYTQIDYFTISNCIYNFNFLTLSTFRDIRASRIYIRGPTNPGRHFQWPWTTLTPGFNVMLFFDAEYFRNGTRCRHSFNGILIYRDLITPYSTVSFRMTLSELEWLSKIFSDAKHRAASLRQLSFLLQKFCTEIIPWTFIAICLYLYFFILVSFFYSFLLFVASKRVQSSNVLIAVGVTQPQHDFRACLETLPSFLA